MSKCKGYGKEERRQRVLVYITDRLNLSDAELFKTAKRFRSKNDEVVLVEGTDAYKKGMATYRQFLLNEKKKLEQVLGNNR